MFGQWQGGGTGVVEQRPCYEADKVEQKKAPPGAEFSAEGSRGWKGKTEGATRTFSAVTRERQTHGPTCYPSAGRA
jgi:hypothetical protein